jgi:hypothetical protein
MGRFWALFGLSTGLTWLWMRSKAEVDQPMFKALSLMF